LKACPECGAVPSEEWLCPACGWRARKIDGFLSFSPELARENEGFKESYFSELASLEEKNFWFRARNRLIINALKKKFPDAKRLMEVGCGTGYVLSGIRKAFPDMKLSGSEIYTSGLEFASRRAAGVELIQMDARRMPFREEFDVIGAFDVLEHIEEDEKVIVQMFASLKPGGGLLLTVPQHPFLWSQQDVAACHVRRYTKTELKRKLEAAGFRVVHSTSFVFLLFPFMMLSRFLTKRAPTDPMSELRLGKISNMIFEAVMKLEETLIGLNFCLPFGGSLLMVARKA
jgi:SAM-dependent methyltransferase